MPLVTPEKPQWKRLFGAACESAKFGNALLAERWLRARGFPKFEDAAPGTASTFRQWNEKLSAVVRLGVSTNVESFWSRAGRQVLGGRERLAAFGGFRGLPAQVHGGGGRIDLDPTGFVLRLRVEPAPAELEELPVHMPAVAKDRHMRSTLDKIASGVWPLKRLNIRFRRGSRKIKVLLTYSRPLVVLEAGTARATISLEEQGAVLVLRSQGRELHLSDWLHRIREMKRYFTSRRRRVSQTLGKARRWPEARVQHARIQEFEEWAAGPLHELSRRIIDWCIGEGVGVLEWRIARWKPRAVPEGEEKPLDALPWYRLREMVKYKAVEAGITVEDVAAEGEAARRDARRAARAAG